MKSIDIAEIQILKMYLFSENIFTRIVELFQTRLPDIVRLPLSFFLSLSLSLSLFLFLSLSLSLYLSINSNS